MVVVQSRVRLISYVEELVDGQPLYVSSNCVPVKAVKYEPAGFSFHNAALKLRGCDKEDVKEVEEEKVSGDKEKENEFMPSSDPYSTKGKKKKNGDQQQDHYALLGLGHLRYLATEDQIKKSYRDAALKRHPDKLAALLLGVENEAAKQAKKDEIENHFKSIQDAYEVLSDPVKRRIYDSTDEFDDEIPTDCAPQDFFKVFGPAFMRNGRWSVNQPVPSLGDDKAPIKDVDGFYDFWYGFKSWREFPHSDEHDLEQAESRDHKRWMERQNAKLSEKARKEDYVRIRSLVDNAYKRDPRILRRKEDEKAEKKRKKEAKFLAKKLQEEEAVRAAEEEKRKKEEEDKRAAEAAQQQKKIKEKEKKLLRKERARLRTLSAPALSQRLHKVSGDDVENLCMSLSTEQLRDLCEKMEKVEVSEQVKVLRHECGYKNDVAENNEKKEERIQQNGGGSSKLSSVEKKENGSVKLNSFEKKEKPWNKEEIELLRKGIQKYPKGISQRWEVISEFIGTGRSVEEILKATKTVLIQKPDSAKAFDSFLEKRKPAPSIASPLTTREEAGGVSTPQEPETSPVKTNTEEPSQNGPTNDPTAETAADEWSSVQEKALVQALKTFPKEATQRWERVAAAVPGKTVNQCKKKFASMKESFRTKKI